MPDHRAGAALLENAVEVEEVVLEEGRVVGPAAEGAGALAGLVAAEVEEGRVLEDVEEVADEVRQEGAGGGVAEAPAPAVRLEERLELGVEVEKGVLVVAAARGRRVAEEVDLGNRREAEVLGGTRPGRGSGRARRTQGATGSAACPRAR